MALLEVRDLTVSFETEDGVVQAVDGVSYTVERGSALGIVGESGSGKSVSSLTVMGLTRFAGNAVISGEVLFEGRDLLRGERRRAARAARQRDRDDLPGPAVSSLHPFYKVGDQLVEAIRAHRDVSKAQALDRAVEMLGLVGIPEPRRRVDGYPHEFSGGMRQRVMIAMGLINDPKLLIADEPTTALDVTVQAQILELLERLQRELDTAIVLITHDLGVVAEVTDDIAVMYAGRIVEHGPKEAIFAAPQHPYTWGLLQSIPRLTPRKDEPLVPIPGRPPSLINRADGLRVPPALPLRARGAQARSSPTLEPVTGAPGHARRLPAPRGARAPRCGRACRPATRPSAGDAPPCRRRPPRRDRGRGGARHERRTGKTLVEVRDLEMHFPIKQGIIFQKQVGAVHAVDGVSFDVHDGETLGIVGESGCGKSTTARAIMRLLDPTGGSVTLRRPGHHAPLAARAAPGAPGDADDLPGPLLVAGPAADRRLGHRRAVRHPRDREGRERRRKIMVQELMEQVGLNPEHYNRLPHQFSGGQRQRIGVARAIALKPKLIVADEPVSALDVSIQAQIINLLRDLQRDLGLTIIFIAHDLSVVRHMCDRVAVMYLGKIVELASADELFGRPRHPYTGALLSAVPVADPQLAKAKKRQVLGGDVPSPTAPPPGCRFHTRCPRAQAVCGHDEPPLEIKDGGNARRLPLPAQRRGRGEDGPHRRRMSTPAGATDRVVAALRAAGVEPDIHEFPQGTRTSRDAADAVGCDVAQIAKSIVFRLDRDGRGARGAARHHERPQPRRRGEGRRARRRRALEGRRRVRPRAHRASRSAASRPWRTRARSRCSSTRT